MNNTNLTRTAKLTVLFTVMYMVSYITRINFGAVISEMVLQTGLTKAQLGMSLTGSFIFYGAGQIVSGACGDRCSPKKLVSIGFAATVLMNLLIPLCRSHYAMLAVWCVNGFAQSFMWPPLVKLMTVLLTREEYSRCSAKVSWGSSLGTMAVYLISPAVISLLSWKWVFVFSALCGAGMLVFWHRLCPEAPVQRISAATSQTRGKSPLMTPVMLGIMLAIILMGMLKDGVTTWMPSFIAETYSLGSEVAILTGVALPVFSIICVQSASAFNRRVLPNPVSCAALVFGAGAVSSALLMLSNGRSAVLSVLFSAVLTGCMHGVNFMLIHLVPAYFKSRGNVSSIAGVLNCCTYIGSALSTYGIALISEKSGWNATVLVWTVIAAAGGALCTLCIKRWKNFVQE
ncbi:MAG: MFS transporter [Clostridia bacterium]|nr:MFS transporter [Clostridia bacterium]